MEYRKLGDSGLRVSAVGLGTWAIGGWMWGGTEEKDAVDGIRAAVDAGINLIDTAPIYGFGLSEELVGKAIQGLRSKVVVATKCGLVWHVDRGDFFFHSDEKHPTGQPSILKVFRYLGPESIQHEVEQSLRRLQVECIDLYQTHWQESTTPIEDTMAILMKLKEQGKIRAIGVSNATVAQIERYSAVGRVDSDQEKFSMLDRELETEQISYCRQRGISVLAYSPLALGLLTGKYGPDARFEEGDQRRNNPRFSPPALQKVNAMLNELRPIAESNRVNLAQLVIAWTIAQPGVTVALVGARNPKQAAENAQAGRVRLATADLDAINHIVEKYRQQIP